MNQRINPGDILLPNPKWNKDNFNLFQGKEYLTVRDVDEKFIYFERNKSDPNIDDQRGWYIDLFIVIPRELYNQIPNNKLFEAVEILDI